jgi:hypothetical protein
MTTHVHHTWTGLWAAGHSGRRRVELRRDDRGHAVGDTLLCTETDPATGEETGRRYRVTVTHLIRAGDLGCGKGLAPGWVALSVAPSGPEEAHATDQT